MDRREIGLRLAMHKLHLPVKVDTFEDRLILQKAVYLAQAAGVHLGYYFRWYLHGPYSPSVADDSFCVAAEVSQTVDDSAGWKLDETSTQKLARIGDLVGCRDRTTLARKLELLASVHFLIDRKQVSGRSPEKIAAVLQRFGKDFHANDVSTALGELQRHGINC